MGLVAKPQAKLLIPNTELKKAREKPTSSAALPRRVSSTKLIRARRRVVSGPAASTAQRGP